MLFKYKSIDAEGINKDGDIDAPSRDIAISALQRRGLVVISIKSEEESNALDWKNGEEERQKECQKRCAEKAR